MTEELLIGIGDLHGHYPALETLLRGLDREYSIFYKNNKSKVKKNIKIVFTGDYIDRGSSSLKIIEQLSELKRKNPQPIITLTGNHELMALGDYDSAKYVLENLPKHSKLYDGGFTAYMLKGMEGNFHGRNGGTEFIKEFGESEEEAFRNYVERLAKTGDIGDWMRKLEALHYANFAGKRILFTHADISKDIATDSGIVRYKDKYDQQMAADSAAIGSDRKYGDTQLIKRNGLFWDRRFNYLNEDEVNEMIEKLKIDFLVVGHTPHDEIISYYDKIFDIDVGMTPAYGENVPAAIVFKKEGIYQFDVEVGEEKIAEIL